MRWWWISVVLAGCAGCPPEQPQDPDEDELLVPSVDGDPSDEYAVDSARFIVAVGGGSSACPDQRARGWEATRLFVELYGGDPYVDDFPGEPLSSTCLYTSAGPGAEALPFADLQGLATDMVELTGSDAAGNPIPAGTQAVHDRLTVVSSTVGEEVHRASQQRFFSEVGMPQLLRPPTAGGDLAPGDMARLALLDTTPDTPVPYPQGDDIFQATPASHGLWLAALAQQITCLDKVACPVALTSRQVMRVAGTAFNPAPGTEAWGTIAWLARAIQVEVTQWQGLQGQGASGPLVINLSLAWHPYFGGGMPGGWELAGEGEFIDTRGGGGTTFDWGAVVPQSFPPDVRAVFHALAYARCSGALVIAAVGNSTGGPRGRNGPMLPAAWEGVAADQVANCATLGLARVDPGPARPLLYAAGGVDEGGQDLVAGRPHSRPHLLTFADHAAHDPATGLVSQAGPPLTGTSVAALVVSSTAAMVWQQDPDIAPEEVMQRVFGAGEVGGAVAPWLTDVSAARFGETAFVDGVAAARTIRVCDVLEVWAKGTYACVPITLPEAVDVGQAELPTDGAADWPTPVESFAACADHLVFRTPSAAAAAGADPCPALQFYSPAVSPYTHPTPDTTGCPDCFVDFNLGRLYVSVAELWTYRSFVVTVVASNGTFDFTLPTNLVVTGKSTLALQFNPASAPDDVLGAYLSAVKEGRSFSWPLLVIQ